ncbi:MAG: HAD-IA family hydrolase [Burkholderiaceae bacterium]|nr:HAD-IA family hydrolase [Burkholderiaceae bacterium]
MLRVILFDLDGTLMDTAPEIADALNETLMRLGHAPVDEALVRDWIGDGARALLGKALAHAGAPDEVDRAWPGFAQDYERRVGTRSVVHEGVRAMLQRLRQRGLRLVLLTNKEAAFAHRLLALQDLSADFDLIVAGDSLPVKKPHPGVVIHALEALHAEPHEALLVGDSVTDVRTARAAGVGAWLVRHGYPQGELAGDDAPDGFIEHFDRFDPPAAGRVAIG